MLRRAVWPSGPRALGGIAGVLVRLAAAVWPSAILYAAVRPLELSEAKEFQAT